MSYVMSYALCLIAYVSSCVLCHMASEFKVCVSFLRLRLAISWLVLINTLLHFYQREGKTARTNHQCACRTATTQDSIIGQHRTASGTTNNTSDNIGQRRTARRTA